MNKLSSELYISHVSPIKIDDYKWSISLKDYLERHDFIKRREIKLIRSSDIYDVIKKSDNIDIHYILPFKRFKFKGINADEYLNSYYKSNILDSTNYFYKETLYKKIREIIKYNNKDNYFEVINKDIKEYFKPNLLIDKLSGPFELNNDLYRFYNVLNITNSSNAVVDLKDCENVDLVVGKNTSSPPSNLFNVFSLKHNNYNLASFTIIKPDSDKKVNWILHIMEGGCLNCHNHIHIEGITIKEGFSNIKKLEAGKNLFFKSYILEQKEPIILKSPIVRLYMENQKRLNYIVDSDITYITATDNEDLTEINDIKVKRGLDLRLSAFKRLNIDKFTGDHIDIYVENYKSNIATTPFDETAIKIKDIILPEGKDTIEINIVEQRPIEFNHNKQNTWVYIPERFKGKVTGKYHGQIHYI